MANLDIRLQDFDKTVGVLLVIRHNYDSAIHD